MDNDQARVIARIQESARAKTTELEGRFLAQMRIERLSPPDERLELFGHYVEERFYIRARVVFVRMVLANFHYAAIREQLDDSIETFAAEMITHPHARNLNVQDSMLLEWTTRRIRGSQSWFIVLEEIHKISTSNLASQLLVSSLEAWAIAEGVESQTLHERVPPSFKNGASSVPNSNPANIVKKRGRPNKFPEAVYEQALRLRAAGKSNREIAAYMYVELHATPQQARAVSTLLSTYEKRSNKRVK